jgi:hypothetical protein
VILLDPQARRRRVLKYLYKNRARPIYNIEIGRELGQEYVPGLDYLRDKGKVEFTYLPDDDFFFDARITAPRIDEIERGSREIGGEDKVAAREHGEFPRKIFIVHGKHESSKNTLENMSREWGLEPVVLAEQPNRGRVLLNKLLDHTSDVGFAFVIMTKTFGFVPVVSGFRQTNTYS